MTPRRISSVLRPGVLLVALAAAADAATLSLNDTTFTAGTGPAITAGFTGHTGGSASDWIGIYRRGVVPDGDPVATWWSYVDGTQSSGSANAAGPFSVINNADLGEWTAHFLANDGYGHVPGISTVDFEIVPAPGITIAPVAAAFELGESVQIDWSGNLGFVTNDWIGIYHQGETPGTNASVTYQYIDAASGFRTFTDLEAGTYDIYLLANDGYYELASSSFEVVPEPAAPILCIAGLSALAVRRRK